MSEKKLNSSAKAFVPQSMLNSTAKPWTPNPAAPGEDQETNKSPAPTSSSNPSTENASTAPSSTKTDNATEVTKATNNTTTDNKPAPTGPTPEPVATPAPAPAPPKPSVWGKKPSSAILTAPTPVQQAAAAQKLNQTQTNNSKNSNNNNQNSRQPRRSTSQRDNRNDNSGGGSGSNNWKNQKNDSNGGNWRNQRKNEDGGGRNFGGRGGGGRGRGGGSNNNNGGRHHNRNSDDNASNNDGWTRGKALPLDLLKPNEGKNDEEKAVGRIKAEELLSLRLSFLSPPLAWEKEQVEGEPSVGPPEECRWISDTRIQEIDTMSNAKRKGGDVSFKKKKNDTAPALEDCKPLEVNEDTRWKAGVFKKDGKENDSEDSDEAVLKKSLLILNKLSLTKFEKLSNAFIDTGIGRNEKCLAGAIELIVKKAQDEPHFASMYAALCLKLSKTPMEFEEPGKMKRFKKMLLLECQKEFEQDTETKTAQAIEGIEDEEERQNKAGLVKKHYLGHMRFIGELYKGELISIKIMLMCLPALLEGELSSQDKTENGIDEEKVECFSKLMTVIGMDLELQSVALRDKGKETTFKQLGDMWQSVENLAASKGLVSNRIKFMLQDLIEMRDNGWVQRREEEKAKTLDQIHKEAAKEARRGSQRGSMSRSTSGNNIRRTSMSNDVISIARSSSKPNIDADGFTEIGPGSGFSRSQSLGNFTRNDSRSNLRSSVQKPEKANRSVSTGGSFSAFNEIAPSDKKASSKGKEKPRKGEAAGPTASSKPKVEYKSPEECGKSTKNYLKEYFVGGDTDDIVLSIDELIGAGNEGSVTRGAKVIESGVLMVMEMKVEHVDKLLLVMTRCISEKKIESESIVTGLNDPLEFLSDIAIDAPLATPHLVSIVSKLIEIGSLKIEFLLEAPEYFRSDGNAAQFAGKVLKKLGDEAMKSETNLEVVDKLMTDMDKESFPGGAQEILSSC